MLEGYERPRRLWMDFARVFSVSVGAGLIVEVVAGALGLWRYRNWVLPVLNVVVMFGLFQGIMLAGLVGGQRPILTIAPVMFMLGAVTGLVYEAANHFSLRAWKFGARPLLGVARDLDKAALIGVAWGATPIVIRLLLELAP